MQYIQHSILRAGQLEKISLFLRKFLLRFTHENEPLLLGFSGGVDSTALLMALQSLQGEWPVHVVHVDHGWRTESAQEAVDLERRVVSHGFSFSTTRLEKPPAGVNLEDWSRDQRFQFFISMGSKFGTNKILLAHQADDQAEVVLKRVLEGASLTKFHGMRENEERKGMIVLRPLLSFRRAEILGWLHDRNIFYLNDPTNVDTTYLRARMRIECFPFLNKSFGKEVETSLCRVAQEADLLDAYIRKECDRNFSIKSFRHMSLGTGDGDPYLIRQLIHFLGEKEGVTFSRQQVAQGAEVFRGEKGAAKQFFAGSAGLYVGSREAYVFRRAPFPVEAFHVHNREGEKKLLSWRISWKEVVFTGHHPFQWTDVFDGRKVVLFVPIGPFDIGVSNERLLKCVRCSGERAASTLRRLVPSIIQEGKLVGDILHSYATKLNHGENCIEVTFDYAESNL